MSFGQFLPMLISVLFLSRENWAEWKYARTVKLRICLLFIEVSVGYLFKVFRLRYNFITDQGLREIGIILCKGTPSSQNLIRANLIVFSISTLFHIYNIFKCHFKQNQKCQRDMNDPVTTENKYGQGSVWSKMGIFKWIFCYEKVLPRSCQPDMF